MLGIKPRLQHFVPFGSGFFSAGGGLGAVYNFWQSDLEVDTDGANISVHELGVQPSVRLLLRPTPMVHVMITPASLDVNLWRQINGNTGIENVGNFSTTSKTLGMVYSAGAAVGINF
jgi:hypothetical protein